MKDSAVEMPGLVESVENQKAVSHFPTAPFLFNK